MVGSQDLPKESESDQMTSRDSYNTGREERDIPSRFVLSIPTNFPQEVSCLAWHCAWPASETGENVKKGVGYSGKGEREKVLRYFCCFPKFRDCRDLPPLSLSKAMVEPMWWDRK